MDIVTQLNQQALQAEQERFSSYLKDHQKISKELLNDIKNSRGQILTIEAVIFAGIVLASFGEEFGFFINTSTLFLLLSMTTGLWAQKISSESMFHFHQQQYVSQVKSNWRFRELYKDETVNWEKNIFEDSLSQVVPTDTNERVLKLLHLNADRIEFIFLHTFIFSVLLLIVHLVIAILS